VTARRLGVIALSVAGVEALACALVPAAGQRLRLWVDLQTVQGIALGIAGSFLLVDRPFVAARALLGRRGPAGPAGTRRRAGLVLLALGALLFAGAWFVWSAAGGR
jgi:hypothetical protein